MFTVPGISGCTPEPVFTTIPNDTPPIVCASNQNYSMEDMASFMYDAEDSSIWMNSVEWAFSNRQAFIDSAVAKAEELQLNNENLQDILTKLILNIEQLDFEGKNIGDDGMGYTFKIRSETVQLPYLVEKAEYKGKEAWFIALNWAYPPSTIFHIATVVFEYGTDNVLFAISCA
ncbi:MAG: hypothetical protein PHF74_07580 [Dehalococcoidales bacterium]|nr:hypothetical protein [Dehalococcoidales bacterium]